MPEKETIDRAHEDAREGKSPSTQAGEFVREEIHHVREGKHGAKSTKQAIAIGLSKARRAGVNLQPPREGTASAEVRNKTRRDVRRGKTQARGKPSRTRSKVVTAALKKEGHGAASKKALASQARSSARRRGSTARHLAAVKAVRTKGKRGRTVAAQKAARTRAAA